MEMQRKSGYLNTEMPRLIEKTTFHALNLGFFFSLQAYVKTKQQHISGSTSHMLFWAILS